ncbi:MAG: hypothetical protein ABI325_01065 [Ginsengibacter sp.]
MKLPTLFLLTLISCGIKSRDNLKRMILNSVDRNDSTIILQSLANITAPPQTTVLQESFTLNPGSTVDILFKNHQFILKINNLSAIMN